MGNTGDHIRGFAHRMTYEEYEELEDTVTEMFRHKKEGDSVEKLASSPFVKIIKIRDLYTMPTTKETRCTFREKTRRS